jgi:glycosyltransferase involved in cell wall biosynthesis
MNPDNPLVSIIIPCWGCRAYIGEAIQSALDQDYSPIEILVFEDCGADGTYEEALKFDDPKLRVYRNQSNLGQFVNKNQAFKYARGSFFKYLDGDDVLERHCVSDLIQAWYGSTCHPAIVFAQYQGINSQGNFTFTPRRWGFSGSADGRKVLEVITKKKQPGSRFGNVTPQLIYRPALESIGGFPEDNAGPGDDETFLKILSRYSVFFLDKKVARYRKHPGGIGSRIFGVRMCLDYLNMVERLARFFKLSEAVPEHLLSEQFIKEWTVWASSHNIMAAFQHKLRGRPSQFDDIRHVYKEKGLLKEFDRHVRNQLVPYVFRTLSTKLRRVLNLPQHPQLFTKKEIQYIRLKNAA